MDAIKQQQKRVVVLVLGATIGDLSLLKFALPHEFIQWTSISDRDVSSVLENSGRFDCLLIKVNEDAAELDVVSAMRDHNSIVPIIAFGHSWQVPAVVQAMKLGATEVCEFPDNSDSLAVAFQRCISSESRKQARFSELIPKSLLSKLTSEEARILELLVQGRTTKEVGASLDVSIRTVHYRKKELLRKLGVQNRSEAIELIRLSTGNWPAYDSGLNAL